MGSDGFDNRDAQIYLGFDVSSVAPPPNHVLKSATVRATVSADQTFVYDPTADPLGSFADPATETDPDAGRPIDLFGVGTRNGYSSLTLDDSNPDPPFFNEASAFAFPGPPAAGARHAYAADFVGGSPVDVSNNVDDLLDVAAWAVGQTDAVAPGGSVPQNAEFRFELDLSDGDIADYVAAGLAGGEIYFSLSSMHGATLGGPATFPNFYLDAGGQSLGQIAQLDLEFAQVPEPSSWLIALVCAGSLLMARRLLGRRRRVA